MRQKSEQHQDLVQPPYPKPKETGGRMIRKVIALLKGQGIALPYSSPVIVALSGGADSMALAHLLVHYGRRIVPRSQISFIHINHGWRAEESDADEAFVRRTASDWGIPLAVYHLKPPEANSGRSWEEQARTERKTIFQKAAKKNQAKVLTAHQADDLAETVLWRLFTGATEALGGIYVESGVEVRPFLTLRKVELKKYLSEEGQYYREDSTNASPRFLRAQMRAQLMPEVERIFPKAIEHLRDLALSVQCLMKYQPGRVPLQYKGAKGEQILMQHYLKKTEQNVRKSRSVRH